MTALLESEPRAVPAPNGPDTVSAREGGRFCSEGVTMNIACSRY